MPNKFKRQDRDLPSSARFALEDSDQRVLLRLVFLATAAGNGRTRRRAVVVLGLLEAGASAQSHTLDICFPAADLLLSALHHGNA